MYTANHDRLYAKALAGKLEMGNVAKSFWYLWMGHFTEEQKRWILGKDVDNDYNWLPRPWHCQVDGRGHSTGKPLFFMYLFGFREYFLIFKQSLILLYRNNGF